MEDLVMNGLFGGAYRGKKILVTGHTGFKGSWLCLWLEMMGAEVVGFSKGYPTEPSHFQLLGLRTISVFGDILDPSALDACFRDHRPEIVFHMAAQSLVRDSYREPVLTYATNVIGTLNVFEAARKNGTVKVLINITTDKVYENNEAALAFAENDRLGGYDLYSSSKACAELLSSSYRNSFFSLDEYGKTHSVLLATVRAGNVIGGGDWAQERLVPDLVKAAAKNEAVVIRNPQSVRPWQHVLEPLSGYLMLGRELIAGRKEYAGAWNFGPELEQCVPVGELLEAFSERWSKVRWTVQPSTDFHEASILKLDSDKAKNMLGWQPLLDLAATVAMTIDWYRNYYEDKKIGSRLNVERYVALAKERQKSFAQ